MPLLTIFQLYRGVRFIVEGNRSIWRKLLICRKSLTAQVAVYPFSILPYVLFLVTAAMLVGARHHRTQF
jgi:hypothetical protein